MFNIAVTNEGFLVQNKMCVIFCTCIRSSIRTCWNRRAFSLHIVAPPRLLASTWSWWHSWPSCLSPASPLPALCLQNLPHVNRQRLKKIQLPVAVLVLGKIYICQCDIYLLLDKTTCSTESPQKEFLYFAFTTHGEGLACFRSRLTKEFQMNSCKYSQKPSHFTFSWWHWCHAQSVGVQVSRQVFTCLHLFAFTLTPPPFTSSAGISWSSRV